jgi:hypothetical protein
LLVVRFVAPPEGGAGMNDRDVATIVRSVIVDRGLPLSLLAVSASAAGWDIRLRRAIAGTVVSISIPDGRPVAIRLAAQDQLEAEVY